MKQVNMYLSERQIAKIKAMAKRLDLTMAEIVRRAIDEYLEKQESK